MSFWKSLKDAIVLKPNAAEVWDCDPLVVVDDEDQVAFAGRTRVQVQPLGNNRFRLNSEVGKDGWQPVLVAAERFVPPGSVQVESMVEYDVLTRGKRRGAAFQGTDSEGNFFTWYINSAADDMLRERRPD